MKLHRINALLLKYYYIAINRIDRLFDVFYWPVLDIVLWGLASYFIQDISELNLISMLLGGVMLWVFVWRSSQDITVFVLEDFWSENLYHLFSSPVKLSEHVLSIIIVGMIRSFITFGVLSLFAFLLYSFNIFGSVSLLYLAAGIGILSLFGWAMGLFVTAMIFRYGKRIQVLAWSIAWIVQPFSCVFYPLESLPPWAQAIASVNPVTYIFENFRNVLYGNPIVYSQMAYSLAMHVIFLVLAAVFLKASFERARSTGLLAKSG